MLEISQTIIVKRLSKWSKMLVGYVVTYEPFYSQIGEKC